MIIDQTNWIDWCTSVGIKEVANQNERPVGIIRQGLVSTMFIIALFGWFVGLA